MENKKKFVVVLLSAALVAYFSFSVYLFTPDMYIHQPPKRYVGAYYYVWYNPEYWSESGANLDYYPSLGKYDSGNMTVLRQHLAWADYATLDFLAVSWWPQQHTYTIANTEKLFSIVNDYKVKLCVIIEAYLTIVPDESQLNHYVNHVFGSYANHDGYFKLYGKPLLIIYDPSGIFKDYSDSRFTIRNVASHTPYLSETGKAWQNYVGDFITIYPGYDDTKLHRENSWSQTRDNGDYYRSQWESVVALGKAFMMKTLVCMVTSWNEAPEQSFIECNPDWGTLYLDITREYAQQFREPPKMGPEM